MSHCKLHHINTKITITTKMMKYKANIAMVFIQIVYAGMALLSKVSMSQGTSPFVFVAYRQAIAALVLSPFAIFLESSESSPLTFVILLKIFFLTLFGITSSLNLFYVAIENTTATFAAASSNAIPSITFVLALLLRSEKVSLKKSHGVAKVIGSIIGMSGAIVFAFVKGPGLLNQHTSSTIPHGHLGPPKNSVKGVLIMLASNFSFSLWIIMQSKVLKEYTAKLRLVTLQCLFSCMHTAVIAVAVDRSPSVWKLELGLPLLSMAYCGIMVTSVTYSIQAWVIEKKGPVFTALYTPLSLIVTWIFSSFLFKETLYLGSVGGAVLLVSGLYLGLWGKTKEEVQRLGDQKQSPKETKEEVTSV